MKQVVCCRECGKRFWPRINGQLRCYKCIMAFPPPEPSPKCAKESSEFAEWFIYHWNIICAMARREKQPEIEEKPKKKKKKDQGEWRHQKREGGESVRQMALARGLDPQKVYSRLRKGWTLEEALEEKQ